MFLNHETAFDTFTPVANVLPLGHTLTASASTLFETEAGWQPMHALNVGDAVATMDGGFARILTVRDAQPAAQVLVPGGALSACSDLILPSDAHVAFELPERICDAPIVSVPVDALVGWGGIRRTQTTQEAQMTLSFADEEMVYAQTGLLLHAHHGKTCFFERKSYGETRALLTQLAGRLPAPGASAAA